MPSDIYTEHQEQCNFVRYLEDLLELEQIQAFSAVNNNLNSKNVVQLGKRKTEGLRPGVPDLIIVTKTTVLFLEMKRVSGGKLSKYQEHWMSILPGKKVAAVVTKGSDEAIKALDDIIARERKGH